MSSITNIFRNVPYFHQIFPFLTPIFFDTVSKASLAFGTVVQSYCADILDEALHPLYKKLSPISPIIQAIATILSSSHIKMRNKVFFIACSVCSTDEPSPQTVSHNPINCLAVSSLYLIINSPIDSSPANTDLLRCSTRR